MITRDQGWTCQDTASYHSEDLTPGQRVRQEELHHDAAVLDRWPLFNSDQHISGLTVTGGAVAVVAEPAEPDPVVEPEPVSPPAPKGRSSKRSPKKLAPPVLEEEVVLPPLSNPVEPEHTDDGDEDDEQKR